MGSMWSTLTCVIVRRIVSPVALLSLALSVLPAALPVAQAAPTTGPAQSQGALAAPGAPLRVRPFDPERPFGPDQPTTEELTGLKTHPETYSTACSQGPVGDVALGNGKTQRIMLTSGHCVVGMSDQGVLMGQDVYTPARGGYERIGNVGIVRTVNVPGGYDGLSTSLRKARNSTDWGVVVLDPSTPVDGAAASRDKFGGQPSRPIPLTGVEDFRTLAPGQVRLDNFGKPICKDGSIGARKCGIQLLYTSDTVWNWGLDYAPGDSGGVNFDPKTGRIIGMTSMGIGPLGAAQRADRALEEGYGIADGQVNENFTPASASGKRADVVPAAEEEAEIKQYLVDNNPSVTPEDLVEPTPKQQFDSAVHAAQSDAAVIAGDTRVFAASAAVALATGATTPGEVGAAANTFGNAVGSYAAAHADNVAGAGLNWALAELGY